MGTCYRLLHVEDSGDDADLVRLALACEGLDVEIVRIETEAQYVAQLAAQPPDAILCDYHLPRFSAERALAILRDKRLDVPFIIVSQHIGETAAVVAMQNGASDYLPKQDLGRLPKAIAAAVERVHARIEKARAEEALRASEAMTRSILNSLSSRIAVLDGAGTIVATNRAWDDLPAAGSGGADEGAVVGASYVERLREREAAGDGFAAECIRAIESVIRRERAFASLEYQARAGGKTRSYLARIMPLEGSRHGAVISHEDVTDQMMAHLALEDAHMRLQGLSRRVLAIQEEDRRSISRELHDDIGQSLTALKISLHRMSTSPDRDRLLAECVEVAESCLEKLRALALDLRPPQLDQLGLGDALTWLAQVQERATGTPIRCRISGLEGRRPPPTIETACYRIAQEAISNATRHARARSVLVGVESDGCLLKLSVKDDGVGFDEAATRRDALRDGHLGLVGMEERAQLAGGRVRISSVPGGGTLVSAVFPVEERAAPAAVERHGEIVR